ncbi:hypothetical protein J5N97_016409 [Dioscorea zingiberensis]|uniref:Mechanosensitive ion channel MscS domain-containing protein n=1 Tax=Dioscorea zingiberensis TaxID=325984 RepID=A0A9D5CK87_9LILI|nr:hypothetical protein J5N97_016409 [Dioscorea zingiberensis]
MPVFSKTSGVPIEPSLEQTDPRPELTACPSHCGLEHLAMSGVGNFLSRSAFGTTGSFCSRRSSYTSINIPKWVSHYSPIPSRIFSTNEMVNWSLIHLGNRGKVPFSSLSQSRHYMQDSSFTTSFRSSKINLFKNMLHCQRNVFPLCAHSIFLNQGYSSHAGSKQSGLENGADVPKVASAEYPANGTTDSVTKEWTDAFNNLYEPITDAAVTAGKKAKEVTDTVVPYIKHVYDSQPYMQQVIVPIGGIMSATLIAWMVLPRILRKFHKYTIQNPLAVLSGSSTKELVPYEKSIWNAVEDPARYLITFMAFSQLGVMISPTTTQYLSQVWRGAVVLSFVWFLHRWKTNLFARAMTREAATGLDREKLLALEKFSNLGLLILGLMALAEACGVAAQSILTVGGIGGVATAFAAKDILGNMFSGLSLQFLKPFSVGDSIKAGSIEGKVVEVGLTTTSLINSEKFPVIVPNSLFSSQVIVNKSRAQWQSFLTKIPIRTDDIEVVPLISEAIVTMLKSNPKVNLENDAPYCFLSLIESSRAELTIGCNLVKMKKPEAGAAEQAILLEVVRIIKQHGAELGEKSN